MISRIACVIIAHSARREHALQQTLPSVLSESFNEVVLVGDWRDQPRLLSPMRYVCVDPIFRDVRDALPKRDIGTLCTTADTIVYINDDHALASHFGRALRAVLDEPWDVLVPNRYTLRNNARVTLNNGERDGYCGGHATIVRRWIPERTPWLRYAYGADWVTWDVTASLAQQLDGARFAWHPRDELAIEDLFPDDPRHLLP